MKRLILLRHAKAVVRESGDDFSRVLADRGRTDMALVATVLADPALRPDLALVSPAARTRETWSLTGLDEVQARFEPSIYEAEAETLLALVRGAPKAVGSLVLVGHNPGIEELAAELAGEAARRGDLKLARNGLPTGALVVLDFAVDAWAAVSPRAGTVALFATPALLGGGRD